MVPYNSKNDLHHKEFLSAKIFYLTNNTIFTFNCSTVHIASEHKKNNRKLENVIGKTARRRSVTKVKMAV